MIINALSSVDVLDITVCGGDLCWKVPYSSCPDIVFRGPSGVASLVQQMKAIAHMLNSPTQELPVFLYELVDKGVIDATFVTKNNDRFLRVRNPNNQVYVDLSAQDVMAWGEELSAMHEIDGVTDHSKV